MNRRLLYAQASSEMFLHNNYRYVEEDPEKIVEAMSKLFKQGPYNVS